MARGLEKSVVFEDDVRFEAYFKVRLTRLMEELEWAQLDWDLMYVGLAHSEGQGRGKGRGWPHPELAFRVLSLVESRHGLGAPPLLPHGLVPSDAGYCFQIGESPEHCCFPPQWLIGASRLETSLYPIPSPSSHPGPCSVSAAWDCCGPGSFP